MRRHELDLTSLVAGLVFIGIAVAYLIGSYTSVRIDAGWVLPIGLVGLGVAGLAGSLRVGLRRDDEDLTATTTVHKTDAATTSEQ